MRSLCAVERCHPLCTSKAEQQQHQIIRSISQASMKQQRSNRAIWFTVLTKLHQLTCLTAMHALTSADVRTSASDIQHISSQKTNLYGHVHPWNVQVTQQLHWLLIDEYVKVSPRVSHQRSNCHESVCVSLSFQPACVHRETEKTSAFDIQQIS